MTRIHARVASLLLDAVAACGVAEKRHADLAAEMDRWIGKPASDMIAARGHLTGQAPRPTGANLLEYASERVVKRPSGASAIMIPVNIGGGAVAMIPQTIIEPPGTTYFSCRLSVNVSAAGEMEPWKAEGNDC